MDFIMFTIGVLTSALTGLVLDLLFSGSGTLKIDRSDPTKPKYRCELDDAPDAIGRKKRYILRIKHTTDLSQK